MDSSKPARIFLRKICHPRSGLCPDCPGFWKQVCRECLPSATSVRGTSSALRPQSAKDRLRFHSCINSSTNNRIGFSLPCRGKLLDSIGEFFEILVQLFEGKRETENPANGFIRKLVQQPNTTQSREGRCKMRQFLFASFNRRCRLLS